MEHFVAYECGPGRAMNPSLMGRLCVLSRKQTHLLRALNNKIWIVHESSDDAGSIHLRGVCIAARISEPSPGGFLIEGTEGFEFDPPIPLIDPVGLERVRGARASHPSAFDRITDESMIDELLEIEHRARRAHRGRSSAQSEDERTSAPRGSVRRDAGRTQLENAAAQQRAMACAIEYYRLRWRNVVDVSSSEAYELHCDDPKGRVLTVKVRGTTGGWENLFLNAAEEKHAREAYPDVALFVLYDVALVVNTDGELVGRGGTTHVIDPWDVSLDDLTPLVFGCRLARSRSTRHGVR